MPLAPRERRYVHINTKRGGVSRALFLLNARGVTRGDEQFISPCTTMLCLRSKLRFTLFELKKDLSTSRYRSFHGVTHPTASLRHSIDIVRSASVDNSYLETPFL